MRTDKEQAQNKKQLVLPAGVNCGESPCWGTGDVESLQELMEGLHEFMEEKSIRVC